MSNLLGDDAKLYLDADAIVAAVPVEDTDYAAALAAATECGLVSNLTLNLANDNPQYRTRGSAWVINGVSKHDGSVSFEMLWEPGDTGFDIIADAWVQKTEFCAFVLDQVSSDPDAQGAAGNWVCTNFTRNEPVGEFQTVSVEIKPSSLTTWFIVGT